MGSSSGVRSLEHTPLNASLFYACPQNSGTNLSGSRGVAQGARVGVSGVLVHSGLSEGGDLPLSVANATGRGLRACQHRGRISSTWESGQTALYEYGRGFPGGESLLLDPGERPRIRRHQQSHNFTRGSQPLTQRLYKGDSGFGLLTSISRRGSQGEGPA